jgi:glyoxylase-like metal-dependent hydrolase (beta-lactamase superfamily II)
VDELAPGLRRWTARHEEWEEHVGSLALETDDGLVLFDPIAPPPGVRRPAHVCLTVFWHYRSTPELKARVWASRRTVKALENRHVTVTDPISDGVELPGGVQAFETGRHGELVYWLPKQKAVVVGDVLLGAGAKPRATDEPLRLCPERWLGKATHADVRRALSPLLDLPVQRVLVSHGKPVLRAGKRALEAVLQAPSAA